MPYTEKKTTIKDLHKTRRAKGATSEKSLRTRANHKILVSLGKQGGELYFDEQLSLIMENAAALVHDAGIILRDIGRAIKDAGITKEFLIDQLNNNKSDEEVVQLVKKRIQKQLA